MSSAQNSLGTIMQCIQDGALPEGLEIMIRLRHYDLMITEGVLPEVAIDNATKIAKTFIDSFNEPEAETPPEVPMHGDNSQ